MDSAPPADTRTALPQPTSTLAASFAVIGLGDDAFTSPGSRGEGHRDTMYGGLLMGQAIRAASATVDADYDVHHLHAEFLRAGRAGTPVVFDVQRTKDGRALSNRRVVGRQGDRIVIDTQISFQRRTERAPEFHEPTDKRYPPPATARGPLSVRNDVFGLESVNVTAYPPDGDGTAYEGYFRSPDALPDESSWHACVLALATDMSVPSTPIAAIGLVAAGPDSEMPGVATTTINHTMWFHRPMQADAWFLIEGGPLSTSYSRGLSSGRVYAASGDHCVSFAQEIYLM